MKTLLQTLKEINGTVLINGKEYLDLSDDVELLATFNAWAWKAKQSSQSEPVAKVIRNSAGQILIQDGKGGSFDMSQYVGQSFYAAPQQAIPSGWKLVPIEPTDEMKQQGWEAYRDSNKPAPYNMLTDAYKAMITAAPTAPIESDK
jgi:hypothetical protein